MTPRRFVIVGGGLAGARAAEGARAEGFDGSIVLLSAEPVRPYLRPPLSKGFLRGERDPDSLPVHPVDWYERNDVELRLESRVVGLDRMLRRVRLADGSELPYDDLLLATGAEPAPLAVPGEGLAGIRQLRTLEDARALRADLAGAGRLVVIGAGWIGCEVAASARQLGIDVVLLDALPRPLQGVLGPDLGSFFLELHGLHGVHLGLLGEPVDGFVAGPHDHVAAVQVAAEHVDCDAVVLAGRTEPRTGLAVASRLRVRDGIVVDARVRSSDPHVLAAGDVACPPAPGFPQLRVESAASGQDQGLVAGRSLVRLDVRLDELPLVTSEQYGIAVEHRGHPELRDEVLYRGDPASRAFIAFWIRGELVRGAISVNVPGVGQALDRIIRAGTRVDRRRLADPGRPLAEIAPPVPSYSA